MTRTPDTAAEEIVSVSLSPLAKVLLAGLAGAICGVVIGLGVSALLADSQSPAPHVPTRARGLDPVQAYFEETASAPEAETEPVAETLEEAPDQLELELDDHDVEG